jgi:dephospho-CoA kinase
VYEGIRRWFAALDAEMAATGSESAPVAIAEIPLLFETGRPTDFDRVVVAVCSPEEQRRRVTLRDGLAPAAVDRRIAAQMPLEEKRRRSDYTIDTDGPPQRTDSQVIEVWERLRSEAAERARS